MVRACILGIGWLLLGYSLSRAQEARVYVPVDTVAIGERIPIAVVVEHAPGEVVRWPWEEHPDTVLGDAEILRVQKHIARPEKDSVILEATTFALDSMRVGPFEVALWEHEKEVRRLPVPEVIVPVRSVVPPEATDIRDLAPLLSFPYPGWIYAAGALLLILVAAFLTMLLKRRKKEKPEEEPLEEAPPGIPPYTAAMQALQELEQRLPLQDDEIKHFYVTASDVLRSYLGDTLRIPAREESTTELLLHLRAIRPPISSELMVEMETLMRHMDLVKFAGFRPPSVQHRETSQTLRRIIHDVEAFVRTHSTLTDAYLQ